MSNEFKTKKRKKKRKRKKRELVRFWLLKMSIKLKFIYMNKKNYIFIVEILILLEEKKEQFFFSYIVSIY